MIYNQYMKNRTTPAHPISSAWVYMHPHIHTLLFRMYTFYVALSVVWGPYSPRDLSQDPCSVRMRSFAFGFRSVRVSLDYFAA